MENSEIMMAKRFSISLTIHMASAVFYGIVGKFSIIPIPNVTSYLLSPMLIVELMLKCSYTIMPFL